jgi:hypothetical protein
MKQVWQLSRKFLAFPSLVAMSILIMTSCNKSDSTTTTSANYAVSGSGSGSQVVPSVSGSGTSTITGTYNSGTRVLNYNTTWTGLTGAATSSAFYSGNSGTNGTLISSVAITTAGSTGASVGSITLTDLQAQALLNGSMYYTVGTSAHANGEVRGQIVATPQ